MAKKHKIRHSPADSSGVHRPPKKDVLDGLTAEPWFPYVIMAGLSVLYFISIFLKDVTFFASEGGLLAYKRYGWGSGFINPFAEDALWFNTYLGGMPGSQGLIEYTHAILKSILCLFIPENVEAGIYYILMVFASGSGMYLYLTRGLNLHRMAGLIVAVAYMFAPANLSLTYAGHVSKMGVYAIMPFQFYFAERGLDTGRFRYFLYLGGLIALAIGTAHLQYAYLAMWGIALYGLFRLAGLFRRKVPAMQVGIRGVFLLLAAVIGLGISARAYVPQYMHASQVSKRSVAAQDQEAGREFAASWSLHPEEIASLVIPEFAGYNLQKEGQYYWGRNPFKINAEYFGVIIVMFAVRGLFLLRRNGFIQFFLFLFLFAVLYSLAEHTPLFNLGYHYLPGMKYVRGLSFLSLLFVFSAMVVAAFGLHRLLTHDSAREKMNWNAWYAVVGSFGGLGLLMAVATGPLLGVWTSVMYSGISAQKQQAMQANMGEISEGALILFLVSCILIALIYGIQNRKIGGSLFGIAFVLLVAVDSWRIDKQFLHYVPNANVRMPSEQKIQAYEYLKTNDTSLYRVLPIHALNNLRFSYEGINLVTGFNDFTLLRYYTVLNNRIMAGLSRGELAKPLLDLLCTKYFVHNGENLNLPGMPVIYNQNDWYIYENLQAFPYLYFSDSWQVIPEEERVLSILQTGGHDAVAAPLIEEEAPAGFTSAADTTGNPQNSGTIQFINGEQYTTGELAENVFSINQPKDGLFTFSENYHPSWHAYVDGEEVKIYRVNYLWRGIFVPRGEHRIEFRFRPNIIIYTRYISFAFIVGFLLAVAVTHVMPRMK